MMTAGEIEGAGASRNAVLPNPCYLRGCAYLVPKGQSEPSEGKNRFIVFQGPDPRLQINEVAGKALGPKKLSTIVQSVLEDIVAKDPRLEHYEIVSHTLSVGPALVCGNPRGKSLVAQLDSLRIDLRYHQNPETWYEKKVFAAITGKITAAELHLAECEACKLMVLSQKDERVRRLMVPVSELINHGRICRLLKNRIH